jgi:ribosomal protein S27AE
MGAEGPNVSILQARFCPHCGATTYHRYLSRLRSRFNHSDGWACVSCAKRERELRRKAAGDGTIGTELKRLGVTNPLGDAPG